VTGVVGETIIGAGDYPLDQRWTAGRYVLHFTAAGNLEFWNDRSRVPVWQSGTHGFGATRLSLQNDGNLVIYDRRHKALWASGTHGNPGAYIEIRPDGALAVRAADHRNILRLDKTSS
jgi:hypothetical protein